MQILLKFSECLLSHGKCLYAVIVTCFWVADHGNSIYSDICKVKGIHRRLLRSCIKPPVKISVRLRNTADWGVLLTQTGPNSPLDLSWGTSVFFSISLILPSNCRFSSAHKFIAQTMATNSHSVLYSTVSVLRRRHLPVCLFLSPSFYLGLKWFTKLSSSKLELKIVNCP